MIVSAVLLAAVCAAYKITGNKAVKIAANPLYFAGTRFVPLSL